MPHGRFFECKIKAQAPRRDLLATRANLLLTMQLHSSNSSTVKRLLEDELARGEPFHNWHGITSENIRSFLVEPFAVWTDPDDLETRFRAMWVVLQECRKPTEGYVIVYDPLSKSWNVAEHVKGGDYIVVITGPSLARALEGM
jgi:hypothetical protein